VDARRREHARLRAALRAATQEVARAEARAEAAERADLLRGHGGVDRAAEAAAAEVTAALRRARGMMSAELDRMGAVSETLGTCMHASAAGGAPAAAHAEQHRAKLAGTLEEHTGYSDDVRTSRQLVTAHTVRRRTRQRGGWAGCV
jgi:hypothetical protein